MWECACVGVRRNRDVYARVGRVGESEEESNSHANFTEMRNARTHIVGEHNKA